MKPLQFVFVATLLVSFSAQARENYLLHYRTFLEACNTDSMRNVIVDAINANQPVPHVFGQGRGPIPLRQAALELAQEMYPDDAKGLGPRDIQFTNFYQFPDTIPTEFENGMVVELSFRIHFNLPSGKNLFLSVHTPAYEVKKLPLLDYEVLEQVSEISFLTGVLIDLGALKKEDVKAELCRLQIDKNHAGAMPISNNTTGDPDFTRSLRSVSGLKAKELAGSEAPVGVAVDAAPAGKATEAK